MTPRKGQAAGKDPEGRLREHGLRATRARTRLLSVLQRARRPLSHTDILSRLRGAPVNRVTVYRTLDALTEAGLVHRAYINDRTWTFETSDRCGRQQCHPHFSCRKCGLVACMTQVHVPFAKGFPEGYLAERQKVHIEGLCPSCAKGRGETGGTR